VRLASAAVKVLGREPHEGLTVSAHRFSKVAAEKIRRRWHCRGHRIVIEQVRNIFRVPELKRRVLFTCALLIVYRIGPTSHAGIDAHALRSSSRRRPGTLGFFDLFSGGPCAAVGVRPGHHALHLASIILQLLAVVVPALEKLQKEASRPEEDHAIHTVRHRGAGGHSRLGDRHRPESMQIQGPWSCPARAGASAS